MPSYRQVETRVGGKKGPDPRNTSARVAVVLCLDTSGSMNGHPINELNAGVRLFYDAIRRDDTACSAADIAIVTFGHEGVKCIQDFAQVYENPNPPSLTAEGLTPMGEAVNMSLKMLEERKRAYKKSALEYYQPWLVLMSDGEPVGTNEKTAFPEAVKKTQEMVNSGKLTVFSIGIGANAKKDVLAQFSPKRPPLKLRGLNFKKFFEWLSQSVHQVSVSKVGEKVHLDVSSIGSWAEGWDTL